MDSDFDFDTPTITRRRSSAKVASSKASAKPATPAYLEEPDVATDTEVEMQTEPEEATDEATPKPKYDAEELAVIFDEIIFSGEYSEQISIRGKLNVVFRTRTTEEIRDINRIVDGTTAVFANTLDGVRSLLQLQYALSMYQGKDLRALKSEERAKFIGRIPGPVVASLLTALAKFDEKVFLACQEGESNF